MMGELFIIIDVEKLDPTVVAAVEAGDCVKASVGAGINSIWYMSESVK